jgi:hypothetical protein
MTIKISVFAFVMPLHAPETSASMSKYRPFDCGLYNDKTFAVFDPDSTNGFPTVKTIIL